MPPVIGTTTAVVAGKSPVKPVATHDVALAQVTSLSLTVPGTACSGPTTPLVMGTRTPSPLLLPTAKHEVGLKQVRPLRVVSGMTCVGPGMPSVTTVTVALEMVESKPLTIHTLGL